jgi:hypothetical protein
LVEADGASYVLHNLRDLELKQAGRFDAVISGHTHQAEQWRNGVLYLNPEAQGRALVCQSRWRCWSWTESVRSRDRGARAEKSGG